MKPRSILYGLLSVTVLSALVILGFHFGWWRSFTNPEKGIWPWAEAMSWIVGMTTGTLSLIVALRGGSPLAPASAALEPPRDPTLLDRENEYDGLHDALRQDRPPGVMRVVGPAGFGKTKVVDSVLGDLDEAGSSLTVYRHVF